MEKECGCGCGGRCSLHGYERHFFTKAEKIEKLKNYADNLKKELKAVEERLTEMST